MEPIRVLHVVTYMGRGGLETMLMNYYRQVDRQRIQFDFLVHRKERWDYDDEIEAMGGRIYRLPRLNPWSLEYKRSLNRFFAKHHEYRIVHSHLDCMSAIPLKAAKHAGVPVRIAHAHSTSQDKNVKYLLKLFYRNQIHKYATRLMACGAEAGDWMFGGEPFEILNNAIDAKQYVYDPNVRERMRMEFGISSDELVVGHVGRFSPPKNHEFLVDVFYEVSKLMPAKLLLVGDGNLRPEIQKKVKELGIKDQVIFAGKRSDVAHLLQAMDVFVFPSVYEGLPLTIVEAQAAGLPCLISERVPIECKKTDLVKQLELKLGAQQWAECVLDQRGVKRYDTYQEISMSGFDVQQNALRLTEYYTRLLE